MTVRPTSPVERRGSRETTDRGLSFSVVSVEPRRLDVAAQPRQTSRPLRPLTLVRLRMAGVLTKAALADDYE